MAIIRYSENCDVHIFEQKIGFTKHDHFVVIQCANGRGEFRVYTQKSAMKTLKMIKEKWRLKVPEMAFFLLRSFFVNRKENK